MIIEDVELLGRSKKRNPKLKRGLSALFTGGLSEFKYNKKLGRAAKGFATGGLSELAKNKKLAKTVAGFATGGMSVLFDPTRKKRVRKKRDYSEASDIVQNAVFETAQEYTSPVQQTSSYSEPVEQYTEELPIEEYTEELPVEEYTEELPVESEPELMGIEIKSLIPIAIIGIGAYLLLKKK